MICRKHSLPHLPFKLYTSNPLYLFAFSKYFEYGNSNVDVEINSFLKYQVCSDSEYMAAMYHDFHWLGIILQCIPGARMLSNQHTNSGEDVTTPEWTIEVNGAVVLKCKQKGTMAGLVTAGDELAETLPPDAIRTFPIRTDRIIGDGSTLNSIRLYFIIHDNSGIYRSEFISAYSPFQLDERVRFMGDIFKIVRWLMAISKVNDKIK